MQSMQYQIHQLKIAGFIPPTVQNQSYPNSVSHIKRTEKQLIPYFFFKCVSDMIS